MKKTYIKVVMITIAILVTRLADVRTDDLYTDWVEVSHKPEKTPSRLVNIPFAMPIPTEHEFNERTMPPQPLKNDAAQCYFNAMYQCLMQITPIKQELITQFGKNPYNKAKQFVIDQFRATKQEGLGQQDPGEALNFMLSRLSRKASLYTIVNTIIDTCNNCAGQKDAQEETFTHLLLQMPDPYQDSTSHPLQKLVANYYNDETIATPCSSCSPIESILFTRSTTIKNPPQVLMLYLKRVLFSPALNVSKKIETPTPFALKSLTFGNQLYRLIGCCMHSGRVTSGHYISLVCNNGQWFLCNDTTITQISQETAQKIATQGFYKKIFNPTFQPVLFFYTKIHK